MGLARNSDSALYPDDQTIRLLLLDVNSLINSQVIGNFDGKQIAAATFAPNNERKILIVSNEGLIEYDKTAKSTIILDARINSKWVTEAVFSPDGKWLAASHITEKNVSEIYVIDVSTLTP